MAMLATPDLTSDDYYKVLGVDRGSWESDISRAYKQLALRHHPDKSPDGKEVAEKRFQAITEAYEVLRDAGRRRTYDQFGKRGLAGDTGGGVSFQRADDLFGAFFGGSDPFQTFFDKASQAPMPPETAEAKNEVHHDQADEVGNPKSDMHILAKATKEIDELKFKLADLDMKVAQAAAENSTLKAQLGAAQQRDSVADSKIQELSAQLADGAMKAAAENSRLKAQLGAAQQRESVADSKIQGLSEQLADGASKAAMENANLMNQLEVAQQRMSAADSKIKEGLYESVDGTLKADQLATEISNLKVLLDAALLQASTAEGTVRELRESIADDARRAAAEKSVVDSEIKELCGKSAGDPLRARQAATDFSTLKIEFEAALLRISGLERQLEKEGEDKMKLAAALELHRRKAIEVLGFLEGFAQQEEMDEPPFKRSRKQDEKLSSLVVARPSLD